MEERVVQRYNKAEGERERERGGGGGGGGERQRQRNIWSRRRQQGRENNYVI